MAVSARHGSGSIRSLLPGCEAAAEQNVNRSGADRSIQGLPQGTMFHTLWSKLAEVHIHKERVSFAVV